MYTLWRGLQRSFWPDKLRYCCCLGGRGRPANGEGEEVETKERGGMASPERGGEGAADGNGNWRKTVYLTDLRNASNPLQGGNGALAAGACDVREVRLERGRQGVRIKGKRSGAPSSPGTERRADARGWLGNPSWIETVSSYGRPASMGSPGQPSGRQSVQQLPPSPAVQTRSRPRLPPHPRVGPANSGWVSNPGANGNFENMPFYSPRERRDGQSLDPPSPASTHTPRGPGYGVYSSSSASSAYSWNNATQSPYAKPHTPPTGPYYSPAGNYPSPHSPPTIPAPAASVKNTQPPPASRGHVPMSVPGTPVNHSPRVQFSPLPTPSRGSSASSSSAGSAQGVQNGSPRSGRAV